MKLGISGNLTRLFISSPLTPLLLLATIAVGAIALEFSLPQAAVLGELRERKDGAPLVELAHTAVDDPQHIAHEEGALLRSIPCRRIDGVTGLRGEFGDFAKPAVGFPPSRSWPSRKLKADCLSRWGKFPPLLRQPVALLQVV